MVGHLVCAWCDCGAIVRVKDVYCIVRKKWVAWTPEEEVRQQLLTYMVDELGYSGAHIVVESSLAKLPHLKGKFPDRRVDVLVYGNAGCLEPLMLIECKEGRAKHDALEQVESYNRFVGAPYVAVVDNYKVEAMGPDRLSVDQLPSYDSLRCLFSMSSASLDSET